jgi:Zn-dependent metalloprotease
LARHAVLYGLQPRDLSRVVLHDIHNLGKGLVIVTFRNTVDGIEVYQEEIKIMMNQDLEALALSGYLMSTEGAAKGTFAIMPTEAIARAIEDLTGTRLDASQFAQSSLNPRRRRASLRGNTPQSRAQDALRRAVICAFSQSPCNSYCN